MRLSFFEKTVITLLFRIRNSKVLLAGLTGCGAEIAKNLVLAGLKSLTLLDSQKARIYSL